MLRASTPYYLAAALAAAVAASACSAPIGARSKLPLEPGGAGHPAHLIVVSVAGLTPAPYGDDSAGPALMETLAVLASGGASAAGVSPVAPASRYPAHATIVTGENPARHGIVADQLYGDRGVRTARYWHASQLTATTLWQVAADSGLRVASLDWPTTVGAEIAQVIPDLVPTVQGETWLGVLADAATPELLELARNAGGDSALADREGATRDAVLVTVACELMASEQRPNLLFLHLSQTAPELAQHGPEAIQTRTAFRGVDAEIDRLLECVARNHLLPDSTLVVVGDRGMLPVHTEVAPNVILAEAGLQVLAPASKGTQSWSALARSNGGSAFVYARREEDALLARQALAEAEIATRAFRILPAATLLERGADPQAWFGLEAEPGYTIGNQSVGPILRASTRLGVGGYVTQSSETDAGFVAWGRGVRSKVRIHQMRQTDIAPTLARLLGLDLVAEEGRPLVGMLDLPATSPATKPK